MKCKVTVIVALLLLSATAYGQYVVDGSSTVAIPFVTTVRDPSSLGLGGTAAMGRNSEWGAFYNASSAAYDSDILSCGISFQNWLPQAVTAGTNINFGVSFVPLDHIGFCLGFASEGGKLKSSPTDADGIHSSAQSTSSTLFCIGGAWRFVPWLSAGLSLRYASQNLAGSPLSSISADVSLTSEYRNFRAVAALSCLGAKVSGHNLPSCFIAGAGWKGSAGDHCFTADAQMNAYFGAGVRACGGVQYSWRDMVFARAGANLGSSSVQEDFYSAGIGFRYALVGLDVTYLFGNSPLAGSMCIGLNVNF